MLNDPDTDHEKIAALGYLGSRTRGCVVHLSLAEATEESSFLYKQEDFIGLHSLLAGFWLAGAATRPFSRYRERCFPSYQYNNDFMTSYTWLNSRRSVSFRP